MLFTLKCPVVGSDLKLLASDVCKLASMGRLTLAGAVVLSTGLLFVG
jgi:hypothetical protein